MNQGPWRLAKGKCFGIRRTHVSTAALPFLPGHLGVPISLLLGERELPSLV